MKYERITCVIGGEARVMETKFESKETMQKAVDRLAELEDKIESGKMLELPCDPEKHIFVICSCKEIEMICDDDYETGTGAIECPFENQCNRQDCEDKTYLQIFKTYVGRIYFDNDTFELRAFAEYTNLEIKIGQNAFYEKTEAERRLAELKGE